MAAGAICINRGGALLLKALVSKHSSSSFSRPRQNSAPSVRRTHVTLMKKNIGVCDGDVDYFESFVVFQICR